MDLQLKGKIAFITGSTAGIGLATAKSLIAEGAKVILNGRTDESVAKAIAEIKKEHPVAAVSGIAADFSNADAVAEVIQALPHIDILINNVGIYRTGNFLETSDDDWYAQFEINVMSGVRLSRYCLPKMLDSNWGRILFISSECATLIPPDMIAYSMTKAAILAVSRGLAQLTKGSSVTVNTLIPGSTRSKGAEQFLENTAKVQRKTKAAIEKAFFTDVRTSSLLQRFAAVEEVANTLTYLASPLSSATNGSAIKVDGGSMGGIL